MDFPLLHSMAEIWERLQGQTAWAQVDFRNSPSPGPALDSLIAKHSADALLLHMPFLAWSSAAAVRLPSYLAGGEYDRDLAVSLGAIKLDREINRVVKHLISLGHARILIPTEGFGERMRRSIVTGLQAAAKGKPASGTSEDYVPDFPESVPEVWSGYWSKSFAATRPTAVVVFDDAHLLSLYGYCSKRGIRIPEDLSVVSLNYESRFEWLSPKPSMMRYPAQAALAHFQQWIDHGLKPLGLKFFQLEMIHGESVGRCK